MLRGYVFIASLLVLYQTNLAWPQASSTPTTQGLKVERVTTGLTRPVFGTFAPGDQTKLYIVEQRLGASGGSSSTVSDSGTIRVLDLTTGVLDPTPFLTISGLANGNEQGLLGLTFHPNYQSNNKFYVNYTSKAPGTTNTASTTRIVEYQTLSSTLADTASAKPVLSITQAPYANHKAGWMGFGPDNHLYIATGDGGSFDDPGNRGQDITDNLLGKMLRIDVNGDDFVADTGRNYAIPATNPFVGTTGDDEIWAYGLRNPWRNSFDRLTGDLYIADVGQNRWEEVNVQPANSPGGQNYGWDVREGAHNADGTAGNALPSAIQPILDYAHATSLGGTDTGLSITGGYVYRGPIAELQGKYFYADYLSERIWSLEWNGVTPTNLTSNNLYDNLTEWTNSIEMLNGPYTIDNIVSFGEDALGNLYIFDLGGGAAGQGEVFRISAVPEPGSGILITIGGMCMALQRRRRSPR
jgi:glucose/arabinose dehydrogenase